MKLQKGCELAGLSGEHALKVDKLYSRILADIKADKRQLEQSTFGPDAELPEGKVCETPMCIAGHTVNLAGQAGYELMKKIGFAGAALIIHKASRPDAPVPRYDSYPNAWALAFIEERAAEEEGYVDVGDLH